MIIIPVYDMLLLPGIRFNFKKEVLNNVFFGENPVGEKVLFLIQKESKDRMDLVASDFYPRAIVGKVDNVDEEGNVGIRVLSRVEIDTIEGSKCNFAVTLTNLETTLDLSMQERKEIYQEVKSRIMKFVQSFQWGIWVKAFAQHWSSLYEIICALSSYISLSSDEKYMIMSVDSEKERVNLIRNAIYEFIEVTSVSAEAEGQQKKAYEKAYREAALKKQIEILQKELNSLHPETANDIDRFAKLINESGMNDDARHEAEKILNRFKNEGQNSHEYGSLYDYLEFMTSLNWHKAEAKDIDMTKAAEILDENHYGLGKIKDRILQQIAVMALTKKQSGSILCFVGAPGTGKTSIGQSIARALDREYVRVSLGGVRDEAEIRGHRRTYIGAMPGRIMEGIKRCGASNPVVVLDEVDKLTSDFHGDPASALLEVLDPEQNFSFTDHYMNVPYDLSDVFFVCTANSVDTIPEPLLNRMEVIQFPGYTASEKYQIAIRHLIPNAMKSMGIKKSSLKISEGAVRKIISDYTAEAGVRGLKKQVEIVCRHAAVMLVRDGKKSVSVSEKRVAEFLDGRGIRHEKRMKKALSGVVTGLAWTRAGGEILFIETNATDGKGALSITGQLGDVMKESAQIALTLVRAKFPEQYKAFENKDIHIHVPAGAVPKDGPSAGITLTTALTSLIMDKPVDTKYAMTGEVSLRGNVMPIGGLPEKLMAAVRAGITDVFIPYDNIEDLSDVADEVKDSLNIVPVKTVDEVLKAVGLI